MLITKYAYLKEKSSEQHLFIIKVNSVFQRFFVWFVKFVRFRQKTCWNTFSDVKWHIGMLCVGSPRFNFTQKKVVQL